MIVAILELIESWNLNSWILLFFMRLFNAPSIFSFSLVLFVYMGVMHRKGQSAKSDKTQPNDCKGRLYSMSEELFRSAQLPVKSLVCRHHWDQIRRENARCSCPREEHSERLHQLDSVGASQMPDRKFIRLRMRTRFAAVFERYLHRMLSRQRTKPLTLLLLLLLLLLTVDCWSSRWRLDNDWHAVRDDIHLW